MLAWVGAGGSTQRACRSRWNSANAGRLCSGFVSQSCWATCTKLLPLPDRGTVYELTPYGRELEPILLSLGRWGTRSMGNLPAELSARSRWLVAAMLAFHDGSRRVERPTTWELQLNDGPFSVNAKGKELTIVAGSTEDADLVITTRDDHLHELLTGRLSPRKAVSSGAVTLTGEAAALPRLIGLFDFPTL